MKNVIIIPARGGSKRLPRKNLTPILGQCMLGWTIQAGLDAVEDKAASRVYVSSEDKQILNYVREYSRSRDMTMPLKIIERPEELATDDAMLEDVLVDAVEQVEPDEGKLDYVTMLLPTSPLRPPHIVADMMKRLLADQHAESIFTVAFFDKFEWFVADGKVVGELDPKRRCLLQQAWRMFYDRYIEVGSVYIVKRDYLIETNRRISPNSLVFPVALPYSIEVDTEWDANVVRWLMRGELSGWDNF